jgi:hypothetical protein
MTTDTIKHLGAEFHRAADSLADTLARLRLAAIKEEIRTLPEQIAKWDAEAARLESQTAEDLLRQALEPVQEEKPEPYRAGLPLERLRKVWAEWEDAEGDVVTFKGDRFSWSTWRQANRGALIEHFTASDRPALRPHGATWARVEALADEAEKPTLLDLTKLPPGTVCEALDDIPRWNGRTIAAGVRFTLRDTTTTEGDEFPMVVTTDGKNSYCIPYVVAARVVKEGGEQ